MSYGLQRAGVNILAGIDFDSECQATYETNIKDAKFLLEDVTQLSEKSLEKRLGIRRHDDDLIMVGCSPCQYWSIIRTSKAKSRNSKNLLHEFHRFVAYFNPGYVVVENVPGILKKKTESGLSKFVSSLEQQGYVVHFGIVNLNDYGVPESRKRFSLIANRVTKRKTFPTPSRRRPTVRDFIGQGFPKIRAGHKDASSFAHTAAGLSEKNLRRLSLTPRDGGSRKAWANSDLQLKTYQRSGRVFTDTYSRMWWDKPAPTITTRFFNISNGRFAHPEQDRAISIREGATLQTFPIGYKFICSNMAAAARMIGNAVPPVYAEKIGRAIRKECRIA